MKNEPELAKMNHLALNSSLQWKELDEAVLQEATGIYRSELGDVMSCVVISITNNQTNSQCALVSDKDVM